MSAGGRNALAAHIPYVLILALAAVLAAAPYWVRLPVPPGATVLSEASFSLDGRVRQPVTLPHRWPATGFGPELGVYRLAVDIPASGRMFLLIPAAQHALTVRVDGLIVWGSERQAWGEPAIGSAYRVPLPQTGGETALLEVSLERESGSIPGYLSQLYLADEAMMAHTGWLWSLVGSDTRTAIVGLQALVVLGIAIVWLARRHDPIFAWLFLIGGGSLAYAFVNSSTTLLISAAGQSYLVFTLPAFGLIAVGLVLSIIGWPRPLWLKISVVALPALLMAGVALHVLPPLLGALIGSLVAIGGHAVAVVLLVRNSLQVREWDRALLAVPFFLTFWYGLRDVGILTGTIDGALLLSTRLRPVTVVAVLTLLMRRLASSLDEIDRVNETLRQRLAAQEKELSALHAKERVRTAQAAREDERGRLMRDLHDGVSGHLVSIIALSEVGSDNPRAIEKAARAALDDLRLVINSLDLGDGDLPLALAELRERLEPQLRRLGVELDWSMEKLPQVSGVTPGNALSVLRILQEAMTNALKHGAPNRIVVRGLPGEEGAAVIEVCNDVEAGARPGRGYGLGNIARRAKELGGNASFEMRGRQASLTLVLPPHLVEK